MTDGAGSAGAGSAGAGSAGAGSTGAGPTGAGPPPLGRLPLVPAAAFVVVWCTGYIAGPLAVEAIEPISLVAVRFAIAAVLMGIVARTVSGPLRVSRGTMARIAATGLMINGLNFVGIYLAFERGLGATLGALLHSLSPVLTALLAGVLLRERLTRVQVIGFCVGVVGVVVVLGPEVDEAGGVLGITFGVLSVLGISLGTLGQRWLGEGPGGMPDVWWSTTIQFAAVVPPVAVLALALEGTDVISDPVRATWTLLYLAIVNSLVGLLLLGGLVRRGGAGASAAVFFLMPPVTAVMAYLVLGEVLAVRELVGLLITVVGVAVATGAVRRPARTPVVAEP